MCSLAELPGCHLHQRHHQFGDAVQRAEFWPFVSGASPSWHTLLDSTRRFIRPGDPGAAGPAVLLIRKRFAQGFRADELLLVFGSVNEAINSLHIAPTTLPVVLTYNTFLYITI